MTECYKPLEQLAAQVINGLSEVEAPDWSDCFQSWKTYVPPEVRACWAELPRDAKLMAIVLGDQLADREHWE